MARARYLKPSFFTNERIGDMPPLHRLAYQGLWCQADREGILKDRPKTLRIEILPYDECDFDGVLNDLQAAGFIVRYEAMGARYIWIPAFLEHQKPHHKEPPSTFPHPSMTHASTVDESSMNHAQVNHSGSIGQSFGEYAPVSESESESITESESESELESATAAAAPPKDVVEIRDLILSKLSQRFQRDPNVWDEAEQFASDYRGQFSEVGEAIAEFRRNEQGPPFPQKLRKYMNQMTIDDYFNEQKQAFADGMKLFAGRPAGSAREP